MSDIVMLLGQASMSDDINITVARQDNGEVIYLVESISAKTAGIVGKLGFSQGEAIKLMVFLEASLRNWGVCGPMPLSPFVDEGPLGKVPIVEEGD